MPELLIILLAVAADQAIKYWAVQVLAEKGSIPLIEGLLHLTYAENTGAAFSMLRGMRWLFVAVTAIAMLVILYALYNKKKPVRHRLLRISLALITGGGIGNLIDRVLHGYVVDYFDVRLIKFAIFNLADSCVTVGAVIFCAVMVFHELRAAKKETGVE